MRGRAIRCDEHERLPYKRFCRTPPLCGLVHLFGTQVPAAEHPDLLGTVRRIVAAPINEPGIVT